MAPVGRVEWKLNAIRFALDRDNREQREVLAIPIASARTRSSSKALANTLGSATVTTVLHDLLVFAAEFHYLAITRPRVGRSTADWTVNRDRDRVAFV